ncbi:MAG: hypothetical protein AAGK37_19395 [Pseudomonadota bacterium]
MNWKEWTQKYWKPYAVTWWAAITPLLVGLTIAFEPLHGFTGLADSFSAAAGNTPPAVLINLGLFGIGLRGAPGIANSRV